MYVIFISGLILWIVYSVLVKDLAIFLANIITFSLAFPVLLVIIKNKIK